MKDLEKLLKETSKLLEKFEKIGGKTKLFESLEDASKKDSKLCIENINGETKVSIEGYPITELILLVALEKELLKRLDPPKGFMEMLRHITGTEDAE